MRDCDRLEGEKKEILMIVLTLSFSLKRNTANSPATLLSCHRAEIKLARIYRVKPSNGSQAFVSDSSVALPTSV